MVNKMVSWEQATKLFIIDLEKNKKGKEEVEEESSGFMSPVCRYHLIVSEFLPRSSY